MYRPGSERGRYNPGILGVEPMRTASSFAAAGLLTLAGVVGTADTGPAVFLNHFYVVVDAGKEWPGITEVGFALRRPVETATHRLGTAELRLEGRAARLRLRPKR